MLLPILLEKLKNIKSTSIQHSYRIVRRMGDQGAHPSMVTPGWGRKMHYWYGEISSSERQEIDHSLIL